MGWLALPFKWLLDWILSKVLGIISRDLKDKADHAENVAQAAQDSQKAKELKPDSNEKETDDAIDDELRRF